MSSAGVVAKTFLVAFSLALTACGTEADEAGSTDDALSAAQNGGGESIGGLLLNNFGSPIKVPVGTVGSPPTTYTGTINVSGAVNSEQWEEFTWRAGGSWDLGTAFSPWKQFPKISAPVYEIEPCAVIVSMGGTCGFHDGETSATDFTVSLNESWIALHTTLSFLVAKHDSTNPPDVWNNVCGAADRLRDCTIKEITSRTLAGNYGWEKGDKIRFVPMVRPASWAPNRFDVAAGDYSFSITIQAQKRAEGIQAEGLISELFSNIPL